MYTSQVEYQGIIIQNPEKKKITKLLKKHYPDYHLKTNVHCTFQYFGVDYKIDSHMKKEEELLPESILGKEVSLKVNEIGVYKKDGKIMNIALKVSDFTKEIEGINLEKYNFNDCLNITLYVNRETFTDEKNRVRPLSSAKRSYKCFGQDLKEDETYETMPVSLELKGKLAVFVGQSPYYHVKSDVRQLISNQTLNNDINVLLQDE